MKKKLSMISAFLMFSTLISGCSLKSQYSEDDYDIVATYIAHAVIKNDKNMAYKLIDAPKEEQEDNDIKEEIPKEEDKQEKDTDEEKEPPKKEDNVQKEDEKVSAKLSQVLGCSDDISIQYKANSIVDEYSSESFTIEPSDGKKLLIIKFNIANNSSDNIDVNLIPTGIKYLVNVNGEDAKPLMTAIPNDIFFYSNQIKAGKKKEAVLVFEVTNKSIDTLELSISSERGEYKYTIR